MNNGGREKCKVIIICRNNRNRYRDVESPPRSVMHSRYWGHVEIAWSLEFWSIFQFLSYILFFVKPWYISGPKILSFCYLYFHVYFLQCTSDYLRELDLFLRLCLAGSNLRLQKQVHKKYNFHYCYITHLDYFFWATILLRSRK